MVSKAIRIQDSATPSRPCDSPSRRPRFGSWPTSTSNATASAPSSSPAASASSVTATWPGMGQALLQAEVEADEAGTEPALRYVLGRNEQAMVHSAAAYARQKDRLQAWAVTASIGPGSTNMLTGAALATINRLPVLLLPSDTFATRVSAPVLQDLELPHDNERHRQRRVQAAVAVLRPGVAARAAAVGAARRDAGADRSRSRPARPPSPCRRTCRPRRSTGRNRCSPNGLGTSRARCRSAR